MGMPDPDMNPRLRAAVLAARAQSIRITSYNVCYTKLLRVIEPGLGQLAGLVGGQHAQGHAGLHPQSPDFLNHA